MKELEELIKKLEIQLQEQTQQLAKLNFERKVTESQIKKLNRVLTDFQNDKAN